MGSAVFLILERELGFRSIFTEGGAYDVKRAALPILCRSRKSSEVVKKFKANSALVLSRNKIANVLEMALKMEKLKSITDLTGYLDASRPRG